MSKHTPGPWFIQLDDAKKVGDSKSFNPIGGCGCCGSPWANGKTPEEKDANARLIAAAPDLLEALRNIVSMADAAHWDKATTGRQLLLDDAKKAIAKAEGKEAADD